MIAVYFVLGSVSTLAAFCLGIFLAWWITPFLPPPQRVFFRKTKKTVTPSLVERPNPVNPAEWQESQFEEEIRRINAESEGQLLREYATGLRKSGQDQNGWLTF